MRIFQPNRFSSSLSRHRGLATRKLLVSLAIITLGLLLVLKNQSVVDVDFMFASLSAWLGIWIVGALILGLILGYANRNLTLGTRELGIRYESKMKLLSLPLVCIAAGANPQRNEDRGLAIGIIAIGDISFGVLSFGGLAFGALSVGGASFGLVSVGGLSIGILALGGAAIGLLAAVGGVAIGYNVVGEVGIGIQHFEDAQILILDLLAV